MNTIRADASTSGEAIVGEPFICYGHAEAYELPNPAPNANISWQASPSHLFVNASGNGAIASLAPASSYSQAATLTYTVQLGGCATWQYERDLWVGRPSPTSNVSGPSSPCAGCFVNYSAINLNPGSNIGTDWSLPLGWSFASGGDGYFYVWAQAGINSNSNGYVQVQTTNPCGSSATRYKYVTINTGGGGGGIQPRSRRPLPSSGKMALCYPNPATDELHVSTAVNLASEPISIRLLDLTGREMYRAIFQGGHHRIDLSEVAAGMYWLEVSTPSETQTYSIAVQP